jgi:PST family polysaccharide transporter
MTASVSTGTGRSSYREILTSSALIGGSSLISVVIGIARTKALALLLGPAGYGLLGAYSALVDLVRTMAQLGLNGSGVREIADAAATRDQTKVARTGLVLRRLSLACAGVGALLLVVSSSAVSAISFGTEAHERDVAWLSIAVFLGVLAAAQGALLQGLRRIADIARIAVFGSASGSIASVALVYAIGPDAIVPSLIAVAAASLCFTWWYCRSASPPAPRVSTSETLETSAALLKLGLAFMASALVTMGAAYLVRVLILRQLGLEAAGLYGAAWTLGGLYIGFVLQALATDFYPRLVGVASNDGECNRIVNEQANVSLLLALPGVLATLAFAPLIVSAFYSDAFTGAASVLQWICLGMALRVLTWPLGYVVVAKNRQALFLSLDVAWTVVNVGLSWWGIRMFGVVGAGIAFFGSYLFHAALVYPVARRLSGFRWSAATWRTALASVASTLAVFAATTAMSPVPAAAVGLLFVTAASFLCARRLGRLLPQSDRRMRFNQLFGKACR